MREFQKIKNEDFMPLVFFSFPPIFGAIIQDLFYGVSLIWICATLSILIIFVNNQNKNLYKDYLTNLYNRRQLDNYLLSKYPLRKEKLAGLMIDINSFKAINDKYGHSSGDEALKQTAEILRKTFDNNDFIARYGGDEFVVFMDISRKEELESAVRKLQKNVEEFNERHVFPYKISLSIGCEFSDETNISGFMERLDDLMYSDKQNSLNKTL
jgi:diguanylate cyclase (GGDEF) domain